MIDQLANIGYVVTACSGGPLTAEEISRYNQDGIFFEGQEGIPKSPADIDTEMVVPPLVRPMPEPRDQIVRVVGHGVDTTIYTHDQESIDRLVEAVKE